MFGLFHLDFDLSLETEQTQLQARLCSHSLLFFDPQWKFLFISIVILKLWTQLLRTHSSRWPVIVDLEETWNVCVFVCMYWCVCVQLQLTVLAEVVDQNDLMYEMNWGSV